MSGSKENNSARLVVARALGGAAAAFPNVHPIPLRTKGLDGRDRHLAEAIHHAAMQRWITLEYLLDRHLKQPMRKLEPRLRGVLLAGAAQLLVLDRLPVAAVVNDSVKVARKLVRSGAGGLVNVVLRRLIDDIDRIDRDHPWEPVRNRLPYERGSILLTGDYLPEPAGLDHYLSIATSHPRALVRRWIDSHGPQSATEMCRHGVCEPPIFVVDGDEVAQWTDSHENLVAHLEAHPTARVQDPTASLAVRATAQIKPTKILDYCAGRGTKTKQAAVLHPLAQVIAADVNDERLAQLQGAPDNVQAVPMDDLVDDGFDLLMLDVPCTNSGALARRPEARYRFSQSTLDQLVNLQKEIIEVAPSLLAQGGYVLYSTCSVEKEENHKQAARVAQLCGGAIVDEGLTLPGGHSGGYHDGGYFALIGPCAV